MVREKNGSSKIASPGGSMFPNLSCGSSILNGRRSKLNEPLQSLFHIRTLQVWVCGPLNRALLTVKSGPDGRGPVPHMSSMHDVEEALKGIFDRLCFVKHVDWNSRLLSFPGWLSHRLQKLESLVLLHEDFRGGTDIVEDCTALSGCCRQIRSLTLIDFKHDLGAYDDVKIHYPRLRFCPASEDSPVGIKIEDDAPSDPKQPLHIICQSLLEGISHQLRTLTLEDGNLLRVEKLLPVFLRLDSVSCPRDGRGAQHHWDWAVESDPAPFAALRDLRDRLSSSQSLQDLRDECADILRVSRAVESAPQVAVVRSAVVPRPSVEDFAKWLIDDSLLAERAYLALDRRGDRSQVN